ncbi:MAG: DNA-processing protein DprA [bacterium]
MDDKKYWLTFAKINKIGPQKLKKLLRAFPDLKTAWQAEAGALREAGLDQEALENLLIKRKEINPNREWEELKKEGLEIITILEPDYPKLLREIYQPPPLLFFSGDLKVANEFSLAVVGTRKPTSYGQQVAREMTWDLVQNGLTIVSGLALGIDALAHQTALEAGGKTIAVLGSGLDKQNIYPSSNRFLAKKIIEKGGLLLSEYPPGTMPLKQHFPARNRLISGLSLGVLVIEAPEKSGTLITANFALEQNRDVFAVPGNIYSRNSQGANNLIKLGAKPTTSASDILESLNLKQATAFLENQKIIAENEEEKNIIELLSKNPLHIDKIIQLSKLPPAQINSTLALMELKGLVRNLGGMNYVLAR